MNPNELRKLQKSLAMSILKPLPQPFKVNVESLPMNPDSHYQAIMVNGQLSYREITDKELYMEM